MTSEVAEKCRECNDIEDGKAYAACGWNEDFPQDCDHQCHERPLSEQKEDRP